MSGPHTLRLRSNAVKLQLDSVRFEVRDHAHIWLDVPSDQEESEDARNGFATFTGIFDQVRWPHEEG